MSLMNSYRLPLLATFGCHRRSLFDFSPFACCILPSHSTASSLSRSLSASYKTSALSQAKDSYRSRIALSATGSTTLRTSGQLSAHSGQELADLRHQYRIFNTQYLWTGHIDFISRTFSTAPTPRRTSEREVEKEELSCSMAEGGSHREKDGEILYPAVDTYGPVTIRGCDLEPGKKKKWCTCGLSKKAPWCDGAHKKTGFRSLKWEVPEKPQSIYQICNCKYTKTPPFCDGTHTNLPAEVLERQKNCPNKPNHEDCLKMCTGCGWKVDF